MSSARQAKDWPCRWVKAEWAKRPLRHRWRYYWLSAATKSIWPHPIRQRIVLHAGWLVAEPIGQPYRPEGRDRAISSICTWKSGQRVRCGRTGGAGRRSPLAMSCTEESAVFLAFSRIIKEADDHFVIMDTAPTGHTLLLLDATGAYHREMVRPICCGSKCGRQFYPSLS